MIDESRQSEAEFRACGSLLDLADVPDSIGVYFLFSQDWRRIIYVGTADDRPLTVRLQEHLSFFRKGKRTMWRVPPGADIYVEAMSKKGSAVASMQTADVLYVPDTEGSDWARFKSALSADMTARLGRTVGLDESVDMYAASLAVWCAATPDANFARHHEKRLQVKLNHHYELGYWRRAPQSWLGQIPTVTMPEPVLSARFTGRAPQFRDDSFEQSLFRHQ